MYNTLGECSYYNKKSFSSVLLNSFPRRIKLNQTKVFFPLASIHNRHYPKSAWVLHFHGSANITLPKTHNRKREPEKIVREHQHTPNSGRTWQGRDLVQEGKMGWWLQCYTTASQPCDLLLCPFQWLWQFKTNPLSRGWILNRHRKIPKTLNRKKKSKK